MGDLHFEFDRQILSVFASGKKVYKGNKSQPQDVPLLVGNPCFWLVLDIGESQLLVPQLCRHQDVILGAVRLGKDLVLNTDVRSTLHDDVTVPTRRPLTVGVGGGQAAWVLEPDQLFFGVTQEANMKSEDNIIVCIFTSFEDLLAVNDRFEEISFTWLPSHQAVHRH